MEKKMIAYCGLVCTECDAYIATKNDDDELREKLAKFWSQEYESEINPDDINCDGCLDEKGVHIGYWSECAIKKCASDRGVENCAHCEDFVCDDLQNFFKMAPEAEKTLHRINKNL